MKTPLVDVLTCAYNHEEHIKECLEGVLNQNTNFKYRHLIGEDKSTDRTVSLQNIWDKKS
tara:strand:+ start:747 stop:926 length:180 start_codon:yes stop_codon:yes gene_type:complete